MEFLFRQFPRLEALIYAFSGVLVVLGAAYLLGAAVLEGVDLVLQGRGASLPILLLDRVLLTLMMAEILYTVIRFAREGQLQVEPFLVIGLIAGVRRILVITAEGLQKYPFSLDHPGFQAVLAELLLLTLMVLALAWAYRMVRGV
ncbi:phosphate-starvation-inducible PsiE family protein [Thermus sediminis]|uniref:phosphate-starvation-inducible PsiE family protein n=1 Tax=Thermus sediminis TaxID=1761908 RepID=UPI000E3CAD83|nr:phosphate-starvation-inducible PsiE family protein [Thermus sediminis]